MGGLVTLGRSSLLELELKTVDLGEKCLCKDFGLLGVCFKVPRPTLAVLAAHLELRVCALQRYELVTCPLFQAGDLKEFCFVDKC